MKTCAKCGGRFEDSMGFCPRDGEVLTKDHAGLVGRTLDNQYEIEKFIAAGGMGAVYRARHILLGDTVAIKVLSPEMSNNTEWLKRFQREGQVARKFRHPNAVLVHDLRTSSDGLIYMVMEYVEGSTLDALLRERGRLTPAEAITLLEPIASVLDAAHSMGVVHRDLKPENVMLGKSTIKLLDLGIAKMREIAEGGATSLTVAGQILGTPYYMSPEQWGEIPRDGKPDIDSRADIYSLGVMFYELISGHKPFGGQTLAELRRGHVSFTPTPLREYAADVPEAFSRVIERALAKDRGDRQSTAGELIAEASAAVGLNQSFGVTQAQHTSTETDALSRPARGNAGSHQTNAGNSGWPSAAGITSSPDTGGIAPTIVGDGQTQSNLPSPPANERNPQTVSHQGSSTSANAGAARYQTPLPTMATAPGQLNKAVQGAVVPESVPATPASSNPLSTPSPVKKGRSALLPILGIVGLFVLVGAGVGGWFVWNRLTGTDKNTKVVTGTKQTNPGIKSNPTAAPPVTTAQPVEVLNWWLDVAPVKGPDANPARAAGAQVAMSAQEKFRFSFRPHEAGYFYVVGPGQGGALTAFLTAQPSPESGVKTNRAERDQEYKLNWMALDKKSQAEKYTVVFSPVQLSSPAFLTRAALHQLSSAEQEEWTMFLAQAKANQPSAAVTGDGGGSSQGSVSGFPATSDKSSPVVFEVNINRK